MIKLEDLKPGLPLVGLEPTAIATIAAVVPIGEGSVQVFYRTPDGQTIERLLGRDDEPKLSLAVVERPWSFDGDGAALRATLFGGLRLLELDSLGGSGSRGYGKVKFRDMALDGVSVQAQFDATDPFAS